MSIPNCLMFQYLLHNMLFSTKVINHKNLKCLIHKLTSKCSGNLCSNILTSWDQHLINQQLLVILRIPTTWSQREVSLRLVSPCHQQVTNRDILRTTERQIWTSYRHTVNSALQTFFCCGIPTAVVNLCFNKLFEMKKLSFCLYLNAKQ